MEEMLIWMWHIFEAVLMLQPLLWMQLVDPRLNRVLKFWGNALISCLPKDYSKTVQHNNNNCFTDSSFPIVQNFLHYSNLKFLLQYLYEDVKKGHDIY